MSKYMQWNQSTGLLKHIQAVNAFMLCKELCVISGNHWVDHYKIQFIA